MFFKSFSFLNFFNSYKPPSGGRGRPARPAAGRSATRLFLNFASFLIPFWLPFGIISGTFLKHFWGPCRGRFGAKTQGNTHFGHLGAPKSAPFWVPLGTVWGQSWL